MVTRSIPANCIAVGNPCKVIKWLNPNYKIRALEEKDIPEMQELYRSTVLNINIKDYTYEEVEDWASCGDNLERWKELISFNYYIGAFDKQNRLVGFSSMNKNGYLHSMFVHKIVNAKELQHSFFLQLRELQRNMESKKLNQKSALLQGLFLKNMDIRLKGYRSVKQISWS